MWKDFFYFSKGEQRAVLLLLSVLAILVLAGIILPHREEETISFDEAEQEEIVRFLANVHEAERKAPSRHVYEKPAKKEPVLAPFDPNLADSIEFIRLGLPPFMAHNILKYRQAGGKFRTADDFSRIYGLSEEQFHTLKPYIYISEAFQRKQDTVKHAVRQDVSTEKDTLLYYKYPEGTLVDVNAADTTELKKIPGIGSGIARTIVAYRNRLGGFYEVEQLRELKYVDEEMMKWFKLEEASIRQIPVNRSGLDRLRAHPYINFYQAKVIIEHRRKNGALKSLSQLSLYEEFTEKDLERLSHYLMFD